MFQPGIVMEGGAVDFNGRGTVMTTAVVPAEPQPQSRICSKSEIERFLKDYYGQRHVVWLDDGIAGDDTDGHIDDLARFVNETTVVTAVEDDPADANYAVLQENLKRLARLRDQDGRPFRRRHPADAAARFHAGERLPATYLNFYFVNGALLVPTYGDRARDREPSPFCGGSCPIEHRRHRLPGDCVGPRRHSLPDAAGAVSLVLCFTITVTYSPVRRRGPAPWL